MIHSFKKALGASALGLLVSSQAYGIVDLQAFIGSKTSELSGDLGGDEVSANHFKAAAHINPIPLPFVTLGFGLTAGYETYDDLSNIGLFTTNSGIDYSAPFNELYGYSIGAEVMAGVSLPGIPVEPFIKLAYNVSAITAKADVTTDASGLTVSQSDVDFAMGGTGLYTSIGLAFSPIPLVSILAEYEFGETEMETPEITETVTVPELAGNIKSNSILVGVQIGI